jgi:hypothetical protein
MTGLQKDENKEMSGKISRADHHVCTARNSRPCQILALRRQLNRMVRGGSNKATGALFGIYGGK